MDAKGNADWFDFFVESWGVYRPRELLRQALGLLKYRILEWGKTSVTREGSTAVVRSQTENHTIGAVVQRVLLDQGRCTRAS